jgi:type I restriction enzyme S subunit
VGNKRTPEVRFPRFDRDWEERKLGDVYTERNERGNDSLHILSVSIHHGVSNDELDSEALGKSVRRSEDKSLYKRVYFGDLVFNMMRAWQGAIGVVTSEGMVSPAYITAIPCEQIFPLFMDYCLSRDEAIIQMDKHSYGVTDFRKRLYWDPFSNILCNIPSVPEQERITAFFNQLDKTITLHQQELTTLKLTKQGFLQKMFPKEGESVPEIRFPGFTDAWELRTLGDLSDIVRGASPRPIQDPKWFDVKSDVGWLRIADVTEQSGRIYHLEQRISELGQEKTRVLIEPHLLLSIAATVGKPVVNYVKTGVHDGFLIFLNLKVDREFMYQWLEMFRPMWQKYGQPGSQVNLNSDLVKNQETMLPSDDEQKKIGAFFAHIDNLITLHQRKFDALKETKKAFLQKMFI